MMNHSTLRNVGERWLPAALILMATLLCYCNSFDGAFVLDDTKHILDNKPIRSLDDIGAVLSATRRPVINLSLAINYALGEFDVWGYHAVNVAIHALAALTLFGIIRRSAFRACGMNARNATWLALSVSLLWVTHPLQTQCVTYIIQRGESLMGLFYLLTLYTFIRSLESTARRYVWSVASIIVCAAGMGTKAVMVTAPIAVLLYDRLLVEQSWGVILKRRWALYLGLFGTWGVLALCGVIGGVLTTQAENVAVGFSAKEYTPIQYLQTQAGVIVHYLRLAIWPHPLCLDYGWKGARHWGEFLAPGLLVLALLGGALWFYRRRPWLCFAGLWFFVILAPTSSFVPIADPLFEHRMYLSLASVVLIVVLAGRATLSRIFRRTGGSAKTHAIVSGILVAALALASIAATAKRNQAYRDGLTMWSDVVAKRPGNARGQHNLGTVLVAQDRMAEGIAQFRKAIELRPIYALAHYSLGDALLREGEIAEAIVEFELCIRIKPGYPNAYAQLAKAQLEEGLLHKAADNAQRAIAVDPDFADAYNTLGRVLSEQGHHQEAVAQYRHAIELESDFVDALVNLGGALLQSGRPVAGIEYLKQALETDPHHPDAHANLGNAYARLGRDADALEEYRLALEADPVNFFAHNNTGNALVRAGRANEALDHFQAAIRIRPEFADAHYNLATAWETLGKYTEAAKAYGEAFRLNPQDQQARQSRDRMLQRAAH